VIPYVGQFVDLVRNLGLVTKGIKQLYGITSRWRAMAAVLVPLLLGVAVIMIIAIVVALGPQIAAIRNAKRKL